MKRLLLVALSVALVGCSVEADFSDHVETETLVAESYRHEIMTIDRLVFTPAPLGDSRPRELEKLIDALAGRVAAEAKTKFGKVESLELQLLAKRAGRLSPDGSAQSLQNDWMRIRNNLFDDRAWFARSAADLEAVAQMQPEVVTTEPKVVITEPKVAGEPVSSPEAPPANGSGSTWKPVPQYRLAPSLTGRWRVESILLNGRPSSDEELFGSTWTFDPPHLSMRNRKGSAERFGFMPEGKHLRVSTSSAVDGWMLYEIVEGRLRVAFYDGMKGRPESFEWSGQQDPMLVVVGLVRE